MNQQEQDFADMVLKALFGENYGQKVEVTDYGRTMVIREKPDTKGGGDNGE
jgi:hypothetical protein